jgi:hypothetical protein
MAKSEIGRFISLDEKTTLIMLIMGGSIIIATTLASLLIHDDAISALNRMGIGICLATMVVGGVNNKE